MKKYKSAYVLGKFLPPHKGHEYLIGEAFYHAEKVTVLVCTLPDECIPGDLRYKWMREHFMGNTNITVKHFTEVVPQTPEEHPDFWNIWVDIAKRYLPEDIDVFVSAEDYGDVYAEKLGIDSVKLPIDRRACLISGTAIRENPYIHWNFIPDVVKPYYVKRIAILGAESSGKSTLTKLLAKQFHTVYVEEYGRTLYEKQDGRLDQMDFIEIQNGRQIIEDALMKQANKSLFCDTEDITTLVSFDLYYPDGINGIKDILQEKLDSKKPYDLYILLTPDCPAIQDGTRNFLEERVRHNNNLKDVLDARGCNYVEVGGSFYDRFNVSRKLILNLLQYNMPLAEVEK